MDKQKSNNISLDLILANRRDIEELSSHHLISTTARDYGFQLLYPPHNWGVWASRMLLVLGVSLILSGITYFFAFNWAKITSEIKFGSIQIAILACLGTSYFYGLQRLSGKILLLSASVLVGVFLAVFGQIYQTGADSYNLFMMLSLLTLPWVVISEFAVLWFVWLVSSNTFLGLYWNQFVLPEPEAGMMIFCYMALFNGLFLGLREYCRIKGVNWLQDQWTRVVLVIPILVYIFIPTIILIIDPKEATYSIILGTLLSVIIHTTFYIVYRFKLLDMWGLVTTIFSCCIILESAIFKILKELFPDSSAIMFLLMGSITLGVFSFAIIKLRIIAKEMEKKHV